MRYSFLPIILCLLLSACDWRQAPVEPTSSGSEKIDTAALVDHSAHWLRPDVILIKKFPGASAFRLHYSLDGGISLQAGAVDLGDSPSFNLLEVPVDTAFAQSGTRFADTYTLVKPDVDIKDGALKLILQAQIVVAQKNSDGATVKVSQVQRAKLIDALYTAGDDDADEVNDLGATITDAGVQFKLWAPTAQKLEVLLFDKNKKPLNSPTLAMTMDPDTGVWQAQGAPSLDRAFYQYRITVYHPATRALETLVTTDPYSLSLSTNSRYSQVIDLEAADTKPEGWDTHTTAALARYEDSIFYELHVRDFSAHRHQHRQPELPRQIPCVQRDPERRHPPSGKIERGRAHPPPPAPHF